MISWTQYEQPATPQTTAVTDAPATPQTTVVTDAPATPQTTDR